MGKKFWVLLGMLCLALSGCAPKEQASTASTSETRQIESTTNASAESADTTAETITETSVTQSATKESSTTTSENNEDGLSLTAEFLNEILFPNGKSSFWSTADDDLVIVFGHAPNQMSFSHFDAPDSFAVIDLPSQLAISDDGKSFTVPIGENIAEGSSRDQLTIRVGKGLYSYYLELVPLSYSYPNDDAVPTRFYFNSWTSTQEAVDVLNKTMDNPNNAEYFSGSFNVNWRENYNEHSTIVIYGVNEQGGSGGGGSSKLQKSAETYTITRMGGGDIPVDRYIVDRGSLDVLEHTDLMN
ncbi:hypothetical protein [Enterococcus sp. AZ109]|uniref:hypothetical protein n=1 Tax=Enterococcus sp. AZ109 TaxID=2774634 RepID=UPI003F26C6FE